MNAALILILAGVVLYGVWLGWVIIEQEGIEL